jgi:hypothetical protein
MGAGATDFVNGIPIMNYLHLLGVKNVYLGNLACQWWRKEGYETIGPEFYSLTHLRNVEIMSETVALVSRETRVKTDIYEGVPPEAIISKLFNIRCLIVSAEKGVVGIAQGFEKVIKKLDINMLIDVDSGSDSLYDGKTGTVQTPLHDFMMLAALSRVKIPSFIALTNYALDGELSPEELDQIVANLMRSQGFLGGYGLTQKDVKDLEKAYSKIYDPINSLIIPAVKGDHKTYRVLSRIVKPSPLAAVILFFDPQVVLRVSPARKLSNTTSLKEAEEILLSMNLFPESRYKCFVKLHKER